MATRRVRGDPVENRRALGDIGNIASLPGIEEAGKLNRPLTRNFRAQLLENANKKVQFLFTFFCKSCFFFVSTYDS